MRHLLQDATGIATGCKFVDPSQRKAFPGEGITDGRVLVVKTHAHNRGDTFKAIPLGKAFNSNTPEFKAAVLMIRKPKDCIHAEFNRLHSSSWRGGHTGHATIWNYKEKWEKYARKEGAHWEQMNLFWLKQFKGRLLVVDYDNLKADLVHELKRVLYFLGETVTPGMMECVVRNREGKFHRKSTEEQEDRGNLSEKVMTKGRSH